MYPIQWAFWASKSGQDWHFVHYNPHSCHFVTFINRMWAAQGPNVPQLAHIHLLYSNSCLMPACSHPNTATCCPRSLSSLDDNILSCINTNRMFNVLHIPKHTQEIPEAQLSYTCSPLAKFPPEVTVIECNAIIVVHGLDGWNGLKQIYTNVLCGLWSTALH